MQNNPLYKKALFQASRRAMLENEDILRRFMQDIVFNKYSEEKLNRLNILLKELYDNDLFEILMGQKVAENFSPRYDIEILTDIEVYAKGLRNEVTSK